MTNDILTHSRFSCTNPPHVLLVDDNPIVLMATKQLLKQLHCVVDTASNGKEAVEKASKENYNLILMDINMPDISGIEATLRIRALSDTHKAHVAIIAHTARAKENSKECLAAGMDGVIQK